MSVVYLGGLYGALPIGLAVALVIWRRYSPPRAAVAGALVTFGAIGLVIVPLIVLIALSGGYASGEHCDGFCTTSTGGFILALFFLFVSAVPVAIAGGIVSAVASFAFARPAQTRQESL